MSNYVIFLNFTDQGIRNIKDSPKRQEEFKKSLRAAGGELRDYFLAMGQFDVIMVVSALDDEAIAKIALSLGSLGNVRTQTHRVFTEDEYRKIVGALP